MCGGTERAFDWYDSREGLSPRVRGNPGDRHGRAFTGRSIPACAGEPYVVAGVGYQAMVYPRVCGGTARRTRSTHSLIGLSPRVRGNHTDAPDSVFSIRSIPACAGEPWW